MMNEPVNVASAESESIDSRSSATFSPTEGKEGKSPFLPESFEPTENEVILGRGKQVATHPGNKRFKEVVLSHIKEYSAAQTKALKSNILSHIVSKIRGKSSFQAGFVKQDNSTGRWMVAEDSAARIATAQIFRDALSDSYKSSKQFKQQRRQDRKGLAKKQKLVRENREQESLLQQHQDMFQTLSLPPITGSSQLAQLQQPPHQSPASQLQYPGVQDRLVGRLNNVLAQLRGGPMIPDAQVPSFLPSSPPMKPEEDTGMVSILADHFGAQTDPCSNPFEPTPIFEDGLIFSTLNGFKVRES
ncbi:Nitrilase family, member 2 [Seminavis robusta]|uniref:Nitrilase family, member 2 n=1 Tax=Seminavis robusta TaxID=568900 RepID=A0A9N8HKQ2_9STRA|nr:Nitrilase family, member 2 [Seminavis robusta]|eukprot:Sro628_g178110.1 Nitrilase family, member 2 (302) ;mRNA; r:43032-43937